MYVLNSAEWLFSLIAINLSKIQSYCDANGTLVVQFKKLFMIIGLPIKVLNIKISARMQNRKVIINVLVKPSRLVDWLRVPTPMRENRVRVWVEVVVLLGAMTYVDT